MRRMLAIAAVLAGLAIFAAIGAGVAVWAMPEVALAVGFTHVSPAGWDADDSGDEVLTATCASGGTLLADADANAQNPTARRYWLTVQTDDVFLCDAATCATPDGVHLPAGVATFYRPDVAGAYSCRSASSNGVIRLHPTLNN